MNFFGLEITKKKDPEEKKVLDNSFKEPENDNGAFEVDAGGVYSSHLNLYGSVTDEVALINQYRGMAAHPEVDEAISDIINEAVTIDDDNAPVSIVLNDSDLSENVKDKIRDEFNYIMNLLNFNQGGYDIFKNWYVDGRLFYHKIIDTKNPKLGIKALLNLDPRNMKPIREINRTPNSDGIERIQQVIDYFVYDESAFRKKNKQNVHSSTYNIVKINKDAVTYVHSGLLDPEKGTVLSNLHKAIKPLNQLRVMEDSVVIYRLARAPERRIFYIDVGSLPKSRAEQYLRSVMNKYKNNIKYNVETGEVGDSGKNMTMLEDYWLPRREGGKGTEVGNLPGGQNLGEIEDIQYFQKRLYKSLNVPVSRLDSEGSFNLGRDTEITRDELKFTKFIYRLRSRFNGLFNDILRTQLILKKIITEQEWEELVQDIRYDYIQDLYLVEQKEAEMLRDRLSLLEEVSQYEGKFFSREYIRTTILKQTEDDIKDIDKQIEQEIKDGLYTDPSKSDEEEGF